MASYQNTIQSESGNSIAKYVIELDAYNCGNFEFYCKGVDEEWSEAMKFGLQGLSAVALMDCAKLVDAITGFEFATIMDATMEVNSQRHMGMVVCNPK